MKRNRPQEVEMAVLALLKKGMLMLQLVES